MAIAGFYAGYFSGSGGNGIAMFIITDTAIIGSDISGVTFDGTITRSADERLQGTISVKVPPGVTVIQGFTAPPQGLAYSVPVDFPEDFEKEPFMSLTTPLGAVNVRLQKMRDLL